MKINPPPLILAGLLASATALPAATLIDGFGTLELEAPGDRYVELTDIDGNWHNQNQAVSADAFQGVMTATTLTVAADATASRKFETPTVKIIANTASGSSLSFSFDYNVTAGSPSIYFHLRGIEETGVSPVWSVDLAGRGGAAYHSDATNGGGPGADTETYSLFDGTLIDGAPGTAYNGGNLNLTGTGTISATIDLSGFTSGGRTGDLSDYDYLSAAFAFDFDEAATIEISNFSVNATTPFVDYFSSDSSADYVYTSTHGTDSATWNVSGGALNLPVTGGSGQTANIFHSTAMFEIGETVSVDIYGDADDYLSVSTTTRGANTSGEDGVRLHWKADGTFQAKNYLNGTPTVVTFDSSFDTGVSTSVTLYLTRETDNTFSAAYDSGSGLTQLNGTGGTEKQIFTAGDTGNGDLYIGVETWQEGARTFDNLWAGSGVAASVTPAIISFTSDPGFVSEPGNVTLSWVTTNAASTTLDGQTVTGTSAVRLVNETTSFTLVVTGADSSTASETMTVAMGESFSIAAVADPQYADVEAGTRGGRQPEEGVNRLSYAVTQFNQRDIDWGVVLGDFTDSDDIDYAELDPSPIDAVITSVGPQAWANSDAILAAWNQLNVPKYNVLGNHEFYVPNADVDGMKKPYSVYRKFGFSQKPYYSYRHKGYRFIVLMADWRYLNWDPSLQGYTDSKNYHDDYTNTGTGGKQRWWNGAISLTQRRWLMELLDESLLLNERVVCMAHDPIDPSGPHSLYNSGEMLDILDGYPNVVMWLDGHSHGGSYFQQNDRHHMNLKGMQEGADRWYQLTFSPQIIYVYQAENTTTPTNTFDISRAEPSVSAPTGFSVVDTAGDAALAWDIEPVGVTQVVIERRHVSTLSAELPTTAETLSWQTLATLALPTTQSYLDAPANPIAEYKYRIRFLDGIEGSRYSQALAPGEAVRMSYEDYAASLGAGYELSEADADGDGKSNALEQFYGTPPETADRDASRELTITKIPAGVTQLVFSYDASTLTSWDIALSKDLITWKTISRDVDYSIVLTDVWTPAGTSESLTRITIETMDGSSFDFEPGEPANFFRLAVTPSS